MGISQPAFQGVAWLGKGWFIYTPVTILFIVGMFCIRRFPFRKSVLWFCLLNIYIIIAWHDWRYGGSYSTRALVQSYPVFALPFAARTERMLLYKWRILFFIVCGYLLVVNLFQTNQYCATILHYNDMNRRYYGRIYLNPDPSAFDMSMLDNYELIGDEAPYAMSDLARVDSLVPVSFPANGSAVVLQAGISPLSRRERWVKIESDIKAPGNLWQSYLNADIKIGDSVKHTRVRLFSPISKDSSVNHYAFYMLVPSLPGSGSLSIYLTSPSDFKGVVSKTVVTELQK